MSDGAVSFVDNGGERLPAGPWQAVLFDFDGVLVESADIKIAAFRALYEPHGPAIVEQVITHHVAHGGVSRRQKIRLYHRELLGDPLTPEGLEALCQRFSELVEDAVVEARPVPGAQSLLAAIAGKSPLFVVSGTPQGELERIVARREMASWFTEVHGSPPDKVTVINDILGRHGFDAAQTLFIGDSPTDHDAARATGLVFIGRVPTGARSLFPADTPVVADLTELEHDQF
jgi:phosphoglycolate phosphatase-like HAD superfamily hydrolase